MNQVGCQESYLTAIWLCCRQTAEVKCPRVYKAISVVCALYVQVPELQIGLH